MIRTDNDPAAETVAEVDDPGTADEPDHVWKRCPECQDEDLKQGEGVRLSVCLKKTTTTLLCGEAAIDLLLRCTSWSSPCNGWLPSTQAWFPFPGRCCRCRSWWPPSRSRRTQSREGATAGLDELLSAGTLFWISIFRMEPMMLMRSLTMMRMYQPLTNSSLSHQGASLPLLFLQYSLYSCSQHQERHLVAATDVLFFFFHSSPIIIIIFFHLSCKSPKIALTNCRRIPEMTERVQRMKEVMQVRMMRQSKASVM